MTGLVARTVATGTALPEWRPGDVLFSRPGLRLVGRGAAVRVRVPRLAGAAGAAAGALADIDNEGDNRFPGPLAIGSLPFDPDAAGELVIPSEVFGWRDGESWTTTVVGAERPRSGHAGTPQAAPDGFTLMSPVPHEKWCRRVEEAVEEIRAGRFDKVVLAREVTVDTNRPIPLGEVVGRLESLYPSCTVFAVDGFVGASPELLVRKAGECVFCHPLAGTVAHSGDRKADEDAAHRLMESPKERREHGFVVSAMRAALATLCTDLAVRGPGLLSLRNVIHLGTEITGRLRRRDTRVLDLVAGLHPTPAVGGSPTEAALDWLAACEGLDRGRYAGPVGWTDAAGDGEWVVGIRSAEIDGPTARLFAGVGIVEGSTPDAELAETQLKLQALLAALVRP